MKTIQKLGLWIVAILVSLALSGCLSLHFG